MRIVKDLDYETISKKLNPSFLRCKEVAVAYLFGSRARGDFTKESDMDFAILLSEDFKDPYDFVRLIGELAKPLKVKEQKINLIVLNDADLELAYKVISEGRVIFERDVEKRVDFETYILKSYLDFKPVLDQIRRSLIRKYTHGKA